MTGTSIRRFLMRALAASLSVAAAAALVALLTGDFGDVDLRVILTSLGFAICSATGSSGAAARLRDSGTLKLLGTITIAASVVAFVLLLVGLWSTTDDWGSDGVWRAFGCVAVAGIATSHACVMLGALRRNDSDAVRSFTFASLGFGAFDAIAVMLPLSGLAEGIDDPWPRIFGAALVLLVLTSLLPAILRRSARLAPPPAGADGRTPAEPGSFASVVIEIADRLDVLNSDPGNRSPEIRAEVERLRRLAQRVDG
jgi:hypothetical protein